MAARTRWVLAATLVALIALVLAPRTPVEGPFIPTSPEQVVEQVPAGGEARRARAAARAAVAKKPDDLEAAVTLAHGYLEAARAEGNDARLIGRAQAALAPWWSVLEVPSAVRLPRAMIKQSLRDFPGAQVELDRLVAVDPEDVRAWLLRARVAEAAGDFAQAEQSCAGLSGRGAGLLEVICRARLRGLQGEAGAGAASIEAALELQVDAGASAAGQVGAHEGGAGNDRGVGLGGAAGLNRWALAVSGELRWWAGERAAAEQKFAGALQLDPNDDDTRAAWADLLLDAQRPSEAVKLLAGREGNDALVLRLCLAQRAAKLEQPACAVLRERVAATRQRAGPVPWREEARFALHVEADPAAALALAEANFKVQREPADVRVLLEAAFAADRPQAAAPALEWMKSTGFEWAPARELVKKLEAAR